MPPQILWFLYHCRRTCVISYLSLLSCVLVMSDLYYCNWENSFELFDPPVCQKSNPFPYSQVVGPI